MLSRTTVWIKSEKDTIADTISRLARVVMTSKAVSSLKGRIPAEECKFEAGVVAYGHSGCTRGSVWRAF